MSPVGNHPSAVSGSPPSPPKYSRTIHGPFTSKSPAALPSRGSSAPSASTLFMSTPPSGGPARRPVGPLALAALVQALAVQRAAGTHELGAYDRRGIRNAPCVDV